MDWLIVALEAIQVQLTAIIARLKQQEAQGVHVITGGNATVK